tara:strand:- start:62 stop:385 length:324 start_codon:yes stop_codon:yes gene_type:complete
VRVRVRVGYWVRVRVDVRVKVRGRVRVRARHHEASPAAQVEQRALDSVLDRAALDMPARRIGRLGRWHHLFGREHAEAAQCHLVNTLRARVRARARIQLIGSGFGFG